MDRIYELNSTTDAATLQDVLFSRLNSDPVNEKYLFNTPTGIQELSVLEGFNTLFFGPAWDGGLRGKWGPSNLSIRQYILNNMMNEAWNDFLILCRKKSGADGYSSSYGYYIEGFSYFLYVSAGFDWRISCSYYSGWNYPDSGNLWSTVYMNFHSLWSWDGSIPFPETSSSDTVGLCGPGNVDKWDDSGYVVFRRNGFALWINLDDSFHVWRRKNSHVKPAHGSFVVWVPWPNSPSYLNVPSTVKPSLLSPRWYLNRVQYREQNPPAQGTIDLFSSLDEWWTARELITEAEYYNTHPSCFSSLWRALNFPRVKQVIRDGTGTEQNPYHIKLTWLYGKELYFPYYPLPIPKWKEKHCTREFWIYPDRFVVRDSGAKHDLMMKFAFN